VYNDYLQRYLSLDFISIWSYNSNNTKQSSLYEKIICNFNYYLLWFLNVIIINIVVVNYLLARWFQFIFFIFFFVKKILPQFNSHCLCFSSLCFLQFRGDKIEILYLFVVEMFKLIFSFFFSFFFIVLIIQYIIRWYIITK
jgi:hypothetical protein